MNQELFVACNDAAFLHADLACSQAGLAILVIDEGQLAFVRLQRFLPRPRGIGAQDLLDPVRIAAAGHGACGALVEVGHKTPDSRASPRVRPIQSDEAPMP